MAEPQLDRYAVGTHLPLLFAGLEIGTVAVILVSVAALGYVCALARARTGSLQPAIAAHVMFNIGGFLAGVIYTIAYRITTDLAHLDTEGLLNATFRSCRGLNAQFNAVLNIAGEPDDKSLTLALDHQLAGNT